MLHYKKLGDDDDDDSDDSDDDDDDDDDEDIGYIWVACSKFDQSFAGLCGGTT